MHGAGNVLQAFLTQIFERRSKTVLHIFMDATGYADTTWLGDFLKTCSHIDTIAEQVAAFGDHVADIDANTEADLAVCFDISIAFGHANLKRESAPHGIDGAGEFEQQAVAGGVGDAAAAFVDQLIDQFLSMSAQGAERSFLVLTNQTGVARNICGHDCCQLPVLAFHRRLPLWW